MTNLTPVTISLSMAAAFACALGIILLNVSRKKAAEAKALAATKAAAPATWVHIGVAPPTGISLALRVIGTRLPELPACGTIEWMPAPYLLESFGLVAGNVVTSDPTHVRVTYDPFVENTALAHELVHVWDELLEHPHRESPGDKSFVAQFTAINADIAVALGR